MRSLLASGCAMLLAGSALAQEAPAFAADQPFRVSQFLAPPAIAVEQGGITFFCMAEDTESAVVLTSCKPVVSGMAAAQAEAEAAELLSPEDQARQETLLQVNGLITAIDAAEAASGGLTPEVYDRAVWTAARDVIGRFGEGCSITLDAFPQDEMERMRWVTLLNELGVDAAQVDALAATLAKSRPRPIDDLISALFASPDKILVDAGTRLSEANGRLFDLRDALVKPYDAAGKALEQDGSRLQMAADGKSLTLLGDCT
ncbi:hypothetical protein [Tropicibacter sp. S64]|uniref:hypothetical protein n=1 Tax=Tropicibacter sp. S64 TaxID=3415122 RepID=UPI003C7B0A2F